MRVTVFGATGHVGQLFVEKALRAGHEVVAYARSPKKIRTQNPRLSVVVGALSDAVKLDEAVRGADRVVSVMGPLGWQDKFIFSPAYAAIVDAMKKSGVKRLIALGTPTFPDEHDRFHPVFWVLTVVVGTLLGKGREDLQRANEIIRGSGLEWTIVRVPLLTNQNSRNITVGYFGNGVNWFRLSREAFTDFLMRQLTETVYIGKAPAISN